MSGKREYSFFEKISLMNKRGKITIGILTSVVIVGAFTGTYLAFTKDNVNINDEKKIVATASEPKAKDIIVTAVNLEKPEDDGVHPEDEEIKEEEQKIKYKDKEIVIPKTKVAKPEDSEDSQKQKSGGKSITADQAVNQYENDGQSVGIDVSSHQGKIDWAAVKSKGIEFAMIRCGFRGNSEGGIFQDAYFKQNINGAVQNGILVGIYFYSTACNEEEAVQEAAWVVNQIKTYRITYPVAYDFEDFGKYRCAGVSGEQATSNAIAFLNYVKSAGYTPMMYANKSDITSRFNKGRLNYKFWLAHYTETTNYTGSYQMWQYTSNGNVPGISGRVDMNVAYFRFSAVAEPKHTHDFDNGTVINTPDSKPATCTQNGIKYIRCAGCSESKKVEIPATGHKLGEWKVTEEATEEKEGKKERKCTNKDCDYVEEKTIEKLEHKHEHKFTEFIEKVSDSTCYEKGKNKYKCQDCDETKVIDDIPLKEHTWSDWEITEEATEEKEGKKERKCTNPGCTATESEKIDKLSPSEGEKGSEDTPNIVPDNNEKPKDTPKQPEEIENQ